MTALAPSLPRVRTRAAGGLGVAAGAALLVGGTAAANGGYFPASWGWTSLALAWVAALALVLGDQVRLSRLELATVAAFAGLAGWFALSTLWSGSATASVPEAERTLVYALGALAALLLVRRASVAHLLVGVWTASSLVALYALSTRLFPGGSVAPDAIVGRRLSEPVGYWNALGILCVVGVLLALGLVVRAPLPLRAAAGASLAVLLPALLFTYSRGAWLALAAGLAVALAVDPRRLQAVSALPTLLPGAVAVWAASSAHALTTQDALAADAARAGHRLAPVLLALALVAAAAAVATALVARRVTRTTPFRRVALAILATAAAGAVGAVALWGDDAARSFTAPPPNTGADLNKRLFQLSSSGRDVQFRVALHEWRDHPLLGGGGGTYERRWLRERPVGYWKIRNAHSVYLETLGETGPLGLALLVAALGLPLLALRSARRHPLVPVAAGAYAATLLHGAVDWDWEMPAVTLAAILCAVAILRARGDDPPERSRYPLLAAVTAVAGLAAMALLGNVALARAGDAVRAQDWPRAGAEARRAHRWAPWSADALKWLGEAQVGAGHPGRGRATLRSAIALDGRDWELWFDLALAERHGGAAQLADLRHALALNPRSPEVREFVVGAGLRLPEASR